MEKMKEQTRDFLHHDLLCVCQWSRLKRTGVISCKPSYPDWLSYLKQGLAYTSHPTQTITSVFNIHLLKSRVPTIFYIHSFTKITQNKLFKYWIFCANTILQTNLSGGPLAYGIQHFLTKSLDNGQSWVWLLNL